MPSPALRTCPRRVALYARATATDPEASHQLRALRQFCGEQPALEISAEFVDRDTVGTSQRPAFHQLLEAATRHEFDLVLFWSVDHFSSDGALRTLAYLRQLEQLGIGFRSHSEPFLDSAGPFKDALLTFLSTLAEHERLRTSDRVRAGMQRARAEGKRISRPPLPAPVTQEIYRLRSTGVSLRSIARLLGISHTTVRNYLARSQ